jgi:protein AFG1
VETRVKRGKLRRDNDQFELAARLDRLYQELKCTDANVICSTDLVLVNKNSILERAYSQLRRLFRPTPPRSVYIHGKVGVGKSMLMDTFYKESARIAQKRKRRRVHFHEFMLNVHERIHAFKRRHPRGDALPAVALQLAQEARILCFDEFQVTDIADAMILKRLFDMLLMDYGVVVVATSNRSPDELYEGGINRSLFLPFIDTLYTHADVMEMKGDYDYRRDKSDVHENPSLRFFWPSDDSTVRQKVERQFYSGTGEATSRVISVRMGRTVQVSRATDSVAWFNFDDLCGKPLGAADYLAVCENFSTVIVDHVPLLNSQKFNEARRFVSLIDALYETKTKLVMASHVPLQDLFVDFDVIVETKDGDEEIAVPEHNKEMFVKGQGGSSSSAATTMIRTKSGDEVEWSATGRIGVSLAQLSAVQDVSFSFQRAESRLAEMSKSSWGR